MMSAGKCHGSVTPCHGSCHGSAYEKPPFLQRCHGVTGKKGDVPHPTAGSPQSVKPGQGKSRQKHFLWAQPRPPSGTFNNEKIPFSKHFKAFQSKNLTERKSGRASSKDSGSLRPFRAHVQSKARILRRIWLRHRAIAPMFPIMKPPRSCFKPGCSIRIHAG
jgi:hypothetical protein